MRLRCSLCSWSLRSPGLFFPGIGFGSCPLPTEIDSGGGLVYHDGIPLWGRWVQGKGGSLVTGDDTEASGGVPQGTYWDAAGYEEVSTFH